MKILLTNDDGYYAPGMKVLSKIMAAEGEVTVVAPKKHQSGMGMAVSLGLKPLAYKFLGEKEGVKWSYLDATPASCVKYALNYSFPDAPPDVVVCGINHGSNASTAACYSGTLGAAEEGALNGITSIGISLDNVRPDANFDCVEALFPDIFRFLISHAKPGDGVFYNINFPDLPPEKIKGVRVCTMGKGRWVKELVEWDPEVFRKRGIPPEYFRGDNEPHPEEGEKIYMMAGQYQDDPGNIISADHRMLAQGYITIVAHNLDSTDYIEDERLKSLGIEKDFPAPDQTPENK